MKALRYNSREYAVPLSYLKRLGEGKLGAWAFGIACNADLNAESSTGFGQIGNLEYYETDGGSVASKIWTTERLGMIAAGIIEDRSFKMIDRCNHIVGICRGGMMAARQVGGFE